MEETVLRPAAAVAVAVVRVIQNLLRAIDQRAVIAPVGVRVTQNLLLATAPRAAIVPPQARIPLPQMIASRGIRSMPEY